MKHFAPRLLTLALPVLLLLSAGIPARTQGLKDIHYAFKNTDYLFKITPAGNGIVYEAGTAVASILVDGRILGIPGHDATKAEAAYKAWKSGVGVTQGNSTTPTSSDPTVQMTSEHTGQITKNGILVALIVAAPGSATGEKLISMSGGNPSPEAMKAYEAYMAKEGGLQPAGDTFSAQASRGKDGHTPTVQFMNDAHFGNDLLVWTKGHIELMRDGDKFADMGYTGGGYGEGAAKRGLKLGINEAMAGLTLGHKADPLSAGWEITTAKGTSNTAVANGGTKGAAGITQKNPYGIEGEAVAATDIFRKQVDPTFTYPGLDKLRKASGVTEPSTAASGH